MNKLKFSFQKSRIILKLQIIGFLITINSFTVFGNPSKRNADEDLISKLEASTDKLLALPFAADVPFIQKVDKLNGITKYLTVGDESPVYVRNTDDSNKNTVVLTEDEDKLSFKKSKRIYIGLRKDVDSKDNYYRATLIFLRNSKENDHQEEVLLNGVKQSIEWGSFDNHLIPGRSFFNLHALQCVSTFLVPCFFENSALVPPENFVSSPHYVPKAVDPAALNELEAIPIKTGDGSDPYDSFDLYKDLTLRATAQGRAYENVGIASSQDVGILGGLMAAVGGVVCGIFSIIASCVDERAYGNMMPPDLAIQATIQQNGVLSQLLGRRRRDADALAPLAVTDKSLDYPGWKTQFVAPKKDVTFKVADNAKGVFYGLGNCPYVKKTLAELSNDAPLSEVIDFYLTVLRAQCIPWMKEYLQLLIEAGFLNVKTRVLEMNTTHSSLSTPKLSLKDILQLSTATELDAFSRNYHEEANNPIQPPRAKSPDDQRIVSRSTNFIVNVALKALERIVDSIPLHLIHLTRHLLQDFRSIFKKLAEDAQNLERCPDDCSSDKEVNYNDRIQIVAMVRFIKFGLAPVKTGADVKKYFKQFYTDNLNSIEKQVNVYS